MDLVPAIEPSGVVSVVGAGGKKSTMYALAAALDRAVVTATVRIPIFDSHVERVVVTDDPAEAIAGAGGEDWPLGLVPDQEREDRYRGYDPAVVDAIAATGVPEAVLVKADGARMRLLKSPGENEPRIPAATNTLLPVASAHVVGKPLTDEHVHRAERVTDVAGRSPGERIRAEDVGRVLASEAGGRKDAPEGATVVPVVNMVDDADLVAVGREIAGAVLAHASSIPRVVLAKMVAQDPVVDVVER
ncbi:MAG: selenium cofactor biosynthesis protein YqeC [Haloarculaceae archaeon]